MSFNLFTFYTQYKGFCIMFFSINQWSLFALDLDPSVDFKKYVKTYRIEITLFNYTKTININQKTK